MTLKIEETPLVDPNVICRKCGLLFWVAEATIRDVALPDYSLSAMSV